MCQLSTATLRVPSFLPLPRAKHYNPLRWFPLRPRTLHGSQPHRHERHTTQLSPKKHENTLAATRRNHLTPIGAGHSPGKNAGRARLVYIQVHEKRSEDGGPDRANEPGLPSQSGRI